MAYQNIPVPFGGYNFCKFSASGLLKCESQSLIFSASDFETNTGDTIPYVAESETEPSDGVILLSAYMGRPPIFSVYKYVSGVLERIHYTSSGLSFSNGFKFVMAISDDDNEPYTIVGLVLPDGSDHTTFFKFSDEYSHMKEYLIPPITYTWQSVAGVSGKGQTYSLSQIATASINNGESVTGASASAFTSLTAQVSTMVTDDSAMSGADAGGISGSGSNSGDQSSGYAFGQGESGTNVSGGGGGYYGGEKGGSLLSGGAGSGYIGNSLVSNKKMVGYNVPTSSAEATKTESVSVYSATKEANKPKAGNGFAKVKFLYNPYRSIDKPLPNNIKVAKFAEGYEYYYGRQEVPTGQQYYDISDATPITLERGGSQGFSFGDLPAVFGIYDPNSSNVVNWYLREQTSSGRTMLLDNAWTGSFSADGNYTFYIIAGGEPGDLENGKGYFTVIRTTDWSNGWGGLGFSNDILQQLKDYFL